MLLETCGYLFFRRIRPLFFFILFLSPILFSLLFLYQKQTQLEELEERFYRACKKEKLALARKERKERFLVRYSNTDPYFMDQKIESLPLLEKEQKALENLLEHPAFSHHDALRDRLQFLRENKLLFAEEKIQASANIQEIEEKQRQPVEMDEEDLKKILTLIDDVSIGPYLPSQTGPQLILKEFRLKKQQTPLQTQVFEVEMELLKREFKR